MELNKLTALMIDDDPGDAELLRRFLQQITTTHLDLLQADCLDKARELLVDPAIDVIFLDYMLGTVTGLEVLKELRSSGELRPIIALTGLGNEKVARDLMAAGADDYLAKRDLNSITLLHSIENATNVHARRLLEKENARLVAELKRKNVTLEERNRRLGELYETAHEFVDNVSHEFRTPLTVIKEFSAIMQEGLAGPLTPEQSEYLSNVLVRVDDLATMIDDMLDISKIEAGMFGVARRPCTLSDTVQRVRKALERKAESNHMQLRIRIAENIPDIYGDPEKIGRIIINLAINAIKFSREGELISLDARAEGEVARISITDNGSGIDPEKIGIIFDRFQQLNGEPRSAAKGFGLGLNIVRELVHLHLGDIDVQSKVGIGSTFSFTVPFYDPQRIAGRFLDKAEGLRQGSSYVTIIQARITDEVERRTLDDTESFIHHHLRRNDLVFRGDTGRWTLLVSARMDEVAGMLNRLERELSEVNRNRPGTPLPRLKFELFGTMHVRQQRHELLAAFGRAMSTSELQHA